MNSFKRNLFDSSEPTHKKPRSNLAWTTVYREQLLDLGNNEVFNLDVCVGRRDDGGNTILTHLRKFVNGRPTKEGLSFNKTEIRGLTNSLQDTLENGIGTKITTGGKRTLTVVYRGCDVPDSLPKEQLDDLINKSPVRFIQIQPHHNLQIQWAAVKAFLGALPTIQFIIENYHYEEHSLFHKCLGRIILAGLQTNGTSDISTDNVTSFMETSLLLLQGRLSKLAIALGISADTRRSGLTCSKAIEAVADSSFDIDNSWDLDVSEAVNHIVKHNLIDCSF